MFSKVGSLFIYTFQYLESFHDVKIKCVNTKMALVSLTTVPTMLFINDLDHSDFVCFYKK